MGAMDWNPIAIAGETVGSLAASAMQMKSAHDQQNFQRDMSNTAHQREVVDLQKAGLNPILSATGGSGASTPTGTMVAPENPLKGMAQNVISAKPQNAQIANIQAQTENTKQATQKAVAETEGQKKDNLIKDYTLNTVLPTNVAQSFAQGDASAAQARATLESLNQIQSQVSLNYEQKKAVQASVKQMQAAILNLKQQQATSSAQESSIKAQTDITKSNQAAAKNESAYQKAVGMWGPIIDRAQNLIETLVGHSAKQILQQPKLIPGQQAPW